MKKVCFILFLLGIALCATSQNINRKYSFFPQETGDIYFIYPQKGFSSKDAGVKKGLVYDITYISGQDSASYTFTYYNQNVLKPDSVSFVSPEGEVLYAGAATLYYVQPKGKNWQHRVSVKLPFTELKTIHEKAAPYSLMIEGTDRVSYQLDQKKWEKQSGIINRIAEVIHYNLRTP